MIDREGAARDWIVSAVKCDPTGIGKLDRLVPMLVEENERQNLVSRASLDFVWIRHLADSAQLLLYVPRGTANWLDLGTGAGFPGLVVAALRPEITVTLVESRARRVEWLRRVCAELSIGNATIVGTRLETMESRNFNVISARAFAPLERLLRLSARFSTTESVWLLPKGRSAKQEVEELRGWKHTFHVEQSITEPDSGIIVGKLLGRKGKNP